MTNDKKIDLGEFRIEVRDTLKIFASKKGRRKIHFILFFSPLVYLVLIVWLFLLPKKNVSFFVAICGVGILIFISVYLFLSLFKYFKNLQGLVFQKKDSVIFLNNKKLCDEIDLKAVIVQPKADFSPVAGISSSIGVKIKNKEIPFFFEYSPGHVKNIAELMAEYLNCPIIEKRVINFGIFSKW